MKFTIERSTLLKTLSHVQSIVEKRNTIPVLSNVRIEAKDSSINFKATDMDIEITEIVEAKVAEETEKKAKGKSWYVLQFEALADFDAAQRRRDQLVASTGYSIQVVFDTPFYKLRAGGWSTKAEAEDKARELSAYNISAFVVKVR